MGSRTWGRIWIAGAAAVVVLAACAKTTAPRAATPRAAFLTGSGNGRVVDVDLTASDSVIQEIAPGIRFNAWTFDGTAPGPVIRVHLGDTVRFTLHNASAAMSHSIDFHAAQTPWDKSYQPVSPGRTASFTWVARYPGVFMYHCGTPPVIQHISNGMYGAIIVEPDPPLAPAREYVLVQSEFYPAAAPVGGVYYGDYNAMLADRPTYVVFNGVATQYKDHPLVARPGELIRLWIVDAGPSHWSAFHVIGALFDNAYLDGNPFNVQHGLQTVTIAPGGGYMVELRIPDAGAYPFVTHSFVDASSGALGVIKVDPDAPAAPTSYPTYGDPMSAGVTEANAAAVRETVPPGGGGDGSSGGGGATSCMPMGTTLSITAPSGAAASGFDTNCLAAPAGHAFTIAFTNSDAGQPHNVEIFTDSTAATRLGGAKGPADFILAPGSVTYTVGPLQPGQYFFRCDIHPQTMTGTFLVAGGH